MKSIKTKIIFILILCILISSISVGGTGIFSAWKMVKQDASQIMELYCKDKAMEVNMLLKTIEQSVETVSDYATNELDDLKKFQSDKAYVDTYTEEIRKVFLNAAAHTQGAMGVYIRYNPDFTDSQSGFFYVKRNENGDFAELIPTDLSLYNSSETEYVGWYYEPVMNGEATWMQPYWNENIDALIVSYVIPLKKNGIDVGVIGMDIDFKVLAEKVQNVELYQNSYAFLTDKNGNIVYHKDYEMGTPLLETEAGMADLAALLQAPDNVGKLVKLTLQKKQSVCIFESLSNNMNLVLVCMGEEIGALHFELFMKIIVITILVSVMTFILTYVVSSRMAKPLIELNIAAKKIADGNLDVIITHQSEDEIGVLAESFRKTVNKLQEYIAYIRGLAYVDSMTGMKSKTAYFEMIKRMNEELENEKKEFAVIVFDLNGLKMVNDRYGHDQGDSLIIEASKILFQIFHNHSIYRIGGDEFVVILFGKNLKLSEWLLEEFDKCLENYNRYSSKGLMLKIARGLATFDFDKDTSYQSVFKRADAAMYAHKKEIKKTEF